MVAGSCVCDPLPPAAEEELGYLCITSDPCMNAEIVIVNGAKTCSVTKKEGCGDNGTTAPKPATPPPSETPSEDTDPTKPATPVNTPPAGVPPVTVPPVVPTDDWCDELPTAYRDCCRETKGSPIDVMKTCVQEETRDADCNIVINVMGDFILGDKAQMNLCCQVVSNSGIIDDSSIVQECKNAFDGTPVDTSTPSEPAATPGDTTSTDDCADGIIVLGKCQPKDFVHLQGGGDGSGCALTAGASGSSDMSWLSLMLLGASLLGLKRFRDHA